MSALEQFKQGVRGKLHILAFERKQKAEAAAKATRLSRRNSGTNILTKLRGYKSQPAGRAKAQARLCRGSQKGTRSSPEGSGARAQGSSPQTGLPLVHTQGQESFESTDASAIFDMMRRSESTLLAKSSERKPNSWVERRGQASKQTSQKLLVL